MRKEREYSTIKVAKGWSTIKKIEALDKGFPSLIALTRAEVDDFRCKQQKGDREGKNGWF